jgi:hypothetical protein
LPSFSVLLQQYTWYFPRRSGQSSSGGHRGSGPSLSKAYAYYEHVTLPRRYVGENQLGKADHVQRRADPGESEPTELYSMFTTPASAFIEWGVGMDLYFSTLRMMSLVLLVAGLMNVPNILFYSSTDYSPEGRTGTSWTLDSSAVCTSGQWVVCTDCNLTLDRPFSGVQEEELDRFRVALDGTVLVLRNTCVGGQFPQGMLNWGTGIFLVIMVSLISMYLLAREVRSDEDKYVRLACVNLNATSNPSIHLSNPFNFVLVVLAGTGRRRRTTRSWSGTRPRTRTTPMFGTPSSPSTPTSR